MAASMSNACLVSQQIDIVYLWVDGSDPLWQIKREKAYSKWILENPNELAAHGNTAGRYRDNGELLFNLRALEKFFPNHGHVYIITDNQTPSWLRASEHITIIDHLDLLPKSIGSVFDSGHIESYIHHIPNLSEKFIYLNDDVFFGAKVDVEWWFGDHLRIFSETKLIPDYEVLQPNESALVNASILSKIWLSKCYPSYSHHPHVHSHSPRPMLKSAMFTLEKIAPELFEQVRSTVFRSWKSPAIVPDLIPRWLVHIGVAQQIVLDPLYISTGDSNAKRQFDALLTNFGDLPFFCINDTCDDALENDFRLLRVVQTLKKLLPEPSKFERLFQESTTNKWKRYI